MSSQDLGERLSAYLDDELSGLQRAALERELDRSDEARQRLEELKAVDRLARELPVPDTPSGYELGFSVRVREQLEKERGRKARPLPRQTAKRWAGARTWAAAAAAALFVAVLLPLLDSPARAPQSEHPSGTGEAPATPAADSPAGSSADSSAGGPAEGFVESPAETVATRAQDAAAALAPDALAPEPVATAPPATAPPATAALATEAPATELPAARTRTVRPAGLLEEGVPAAAPTARGGRAERQPEEKPALDPVVEPAADRAAPRRSAASAASEGLVPRAPAPVPPARKSARTDPRSLDEAPLVADDDAIQARGFARGPAAEQAYRGLRARAATTVAASRELREAWRAYATDSPGSAHADEARVQVIEEGLHAYALSGEAIDQSAARRDAAAYLKRSDADQEDRVRALFTAMGSDPIEEE